jgi:nicotinate-nucleotide adenylyltransferase
LTYLKKTMPLARLIWVMGADNLDQFSCWHRHQDMIRLLPIAVIDRPSYSKKAIAVGRWLLGRRYRVSKMRHAIAMRSLKLPSWCFIAGQRHAASATEIRQQAKSANA